MKFIGIIPARYASTRFPGKPLAKLGGKTVIERVYESVKGNVDEAIVATDDERIYAAVESFGGRAVMTSEHHRSGTDRCLEAYKKSGSDADVIVNVQGDEPFIQASQIELLKRCFEKEDTEIATLVKAFDTAGDYADLENPNRPKVVMDSEGKALYFSRSVIPYVRGAERSVWPACVQYYTHVGIYAYRADILAKIVELPQSLAEQAESLEQLRWLQGGYRIQTAVTDVSTIGIDTPADLAAAEEYLKSRGRKS